VSSRPPASRPPASRPPASRPPAPCPLAPRPPASCLLASCPPTSYPSKKHPAPALHHSHECRRGKRLGGLREARSPRPRAAHRPGSRSLCRAGFHQREEHHWCPEKHQNPFRRDRQIDWRRLDRGSGCLLLWHQAADPGSPQETRNNRASSVSRSQSSGIRQKEEPGQGSCTEEMGIYAVAFLVKHADQCRKRPDRFADGVLSTRGYYDHSYGGPTDAELNGQNTTIAQKESVA
jgi:hypothetical protein